MVEAEYYDPSADWSLIPSHMHGGVNRYVMHGIGGGSFLSAVMANDFMEAAGRADMDNGARLKEWAMFVYNCTPSQCHGSYDAVERWIASGGIVGQQAKAHAAS